eukprot:GGOE01054089.1.p1 GENE.GGOE01054089.1~~GGOE01054089.1.p1  ORF type:complete len:294 (+),score=44.17 GGOE01054089.1:450-1331(+)
MPRFLPSKPMGDSPLACHHAAHCSHPAACALLRASHTVAAGPCPYAQVARWLAAGYPFCALLPSAVPRSMPPRNPNNNAVINRLNSEVGVSRSLGLVPPHGYSQNDTFGAPTKADPEGAGKLMFQWQEPPGRPEVVDHGRDFKRLNMMAVHKGMSSASDLAHFRTAHDCRITTKPGDVLRLKGQCPTKLDVDHTYGAPRPLEPPIRDLLSHTYEHEWLEAQDRRLAKAAQKSKAPVARILHGAPSDAHHPTSPHSPTRVCFLPLTNSMAKLEPTRSSPSHERHADEVVEEDYS